MSIINSLEGVQLVLQNLKAKNDLIAAGVNRGLKKAGLTLQRESQRLAPVEFGPLKASAYTRATGTGFKTIVYVGYTAAYALYVHEAVGMVLKGQPRTGAQHKGRFWDPQGRAQAKFLEEPARRLTPQMLKQIQDEIKIL